MCEMRACPGRDTRNRETDAVGRDLAEVRYRRADYKVNPAPLPLLVTDHGGDLLARPSKALITALVF